VSGLPRAAPFDPAVTPWDYRRLIVPKVPCVWPVPERCTVHRQFGEYFALAAPVVRPGRTALTVTRSDRSQG